jgi:hypothetical protein
LPEAAGAYPEGVGDFHIPAVGGAVTQGVVGRDLQEPVPSGSMDRAACARGTAPK